MEEIKKAVEQGNIVIGTERTLKELKKGNLGKVFVSSNCPAEVLEDLDHYTSIASVEKEQLEMYNDALGTLCKKPFPVSVLGIKK
ncbi:MAG: ribosomal L7Ae/L30e/S12e/Gadd45 family protein [Nanobdellota archaeon]